MTVLQEIAKERRRQQKIEGFDADHDDGHEQGVLAKAAMAYCQSASTGLDDTTVLRRKPPTYWPWDVAWWKPSSCRRDLIKAAALIIAEIEHFDRIVDRRD